MAEPRTRVETAAAPAAIGPYSQGIRSGDFVFVSGQIPLDPASGTLVPGGIREQTRRALENLVGVLTAAGLKPGDALKTTVYMTDLGQFAEMNAVYGEFFGGTPPARATVEVRALPKGALVEIDAIARAGASG